MVRGQCSALGAIMKTLHINGSVLKITLLGPNTLSLHCLPWAGYNYCPHTASCPSVSTNNKTFPHITFSLVDFSLMKAKISFWNRHVFQL